MVKKKEKVKKVKPVEPAKEVAEESVKRAAEEPVKKVTEEPVEKPEKGKKGKKAGIVLGIILGVAIVGFGGWWGVKTYLGRTVVETAMVETTEDMRSFSGFFREYLADRVGIENLTKNQFREKTREEILDELTILKDGFARVSRGMNGFEEESEYSEMAKIMKADATNYLTLIRELRAVETEGFETEADRQAAFMKIVNTHEGEAKSGLYLSRTAFEEGRSGLATLGVLIVEGDAMVEVGGGVMNVFVGDAERHTVAVTTEDFDGVVKMVKGEKLFGLVNSRLVKFGESVRGMLEIGKLKDVKIGLSGTEAEIKTTSLGTWGETTWSLEEKLEKAEIRGLVAEDKMGVAEALTRAEAALRGK